MAVGDRVDQFRALARQALRDLFDQREPFGRLALVQVLMLGGDTLITFSLAKSLFFSISPHEAKSKVLLYLLLTLAPFAVVSPLLGPMIDRSRGARRLMVVTSAIGRAALCPFMARDIHSLLLFPEAFLVLVFSKLYLVTRGALVPEMMTMSPPPHASGDEALTEHPAGPEATAVSMAAPNPDGQPSADQPAVALPGYAALNARLTLLGTLAGFAASIPGIPLLKLGGAPAVLIFDAFVFIAAATAGLRLPVRKTRRRLSSRGSTPAARRSGDEWGPQSVDPDLASFQPVAHPEVLLGLAANSLLRGIAGFLLFMLAFGLRHLNASLAWYGFALAASGAGSLIGLFIVPRLRRRLPEGQILLIALWTVAVGASVSTVWRVLTAQCLLCMVVGVAGSLGQPSFDAMTQRYVPEEQQGRAFARFATRQQLVWVVGALVPVLISLPLPAGDFIIAVAAAAGGLFYVSSRRALRFRALPRQHRNLG